MHTQYFTKWIVKKSILPTTLTEFFSMIILFTLIFVRFYIDKLFPVVGWDLQQHFHDLEEWKWTIIGNEYISIVRVWLARNHADLKQ